MTAATYDPRPARRCSPVTPVFLGTVIARPMSFAQAGIAVRTITLLITDCGDYGSVRCKPPT